MSLLYAPSSSFHIIIIILLLLFSFLNNINNNDLVIPTFQNKNTHLTANDLSNNFGKTGTNKISHTPNIRHFRNSPTFSPAMFQNNVNNNRLGMRNNNNNNAAMVRKTQNINDSKSDDSSSEDECMQ